MWFPAPNFEYSSKDSDSLFIAFAWRELFEENTPQIYQPSLLNIPDLLEELEKVATHTLKDEHGKRKPLESLIEELQSQAESDKVLRKCFPDVHHGISSLKKDTPAGKVKIFSIVNQEKLADYDYRTYDYFLSTLETFHKASGKPKKEMLLALRSLATLAVSQGFSSNECRLIVEKSTLSLEPIGVGQQILQSLRTKEEQSWECFFALRGEPRFICKLMAINGFTPLPKKWTPQECYKYADKHKFHKFHNNTEGCTERFVGKFQGKSASQAFENSLSLLKRVLGAANLYHHSTSFEIAPYAFVKSVERWEETSSQIFSFYKGTDLPLQYQATEKLVKELQENSLIRRSNQAMNSLELYSLAHASWDLRSRFIHLWVALEALIGPASEDSIIGNLLNRITPIVVHHHLHSVIRYLAICLHEFGFCGTVPNTTGGFTKSTADKIRTDELLLALTGSDGKYKQIVNNLLAVVAKHPLLCNRIYTASEGGFKTPEAMKKEFLDNCEELTNWQLRRIYRARNLLVHQGIAVPQLQYLFEKLNYYYSVTFSKVIHDLQDHPHWSVDHSYEHRRQEFEFFSHQLSGSTSPLRVVDVFPREEGSAELLWP